MRIVLLGPPGAGKGSLASLIGQRLRVAHLSTGAIFREEMSRRTSLGRRVAQYVTSGRLVPDALVVQVMGAQLRRLAAATGFVLDGFPRTAGQAAGLDRVLSRLRRPLDGAVILTAPARLLVWRLSGRRVCERCGANYHVRTMRPKRPGVCDRCRGRLGVRKDDEPRTIARRLAVDRTAARPLVRYYRRGGRLFPVDGRGSVERVYGRAVALCRRQEWLSPGG